MARWPITATSATTTRSSSKRSAFRLARTRWTLKSWRPSRRPASRSVRTRRSLSPSPLLPADRTDTREIRLATVLKAKENPTFVMAQGAVVLSLDAELLWGHLDMLGEKRFNARYPNARAAYDHVLRSLCNAGVSATWLVVGGMALSECRGGADARMKGLPAAWRERIPAGNEVTSPLWYRRS